MKDRSVSFFLITVILIILIVLNIKNIDKAEKRIASLEATVIGLQTKMKPLNMVDDFGTKPVVGPNPRKAKK